MDYINERLNEQIEWYDTKAISYKKGYDYISIIILIFVSSIPILNLIGAITQEFQNGILIISSVLSGIVTILFGYLKVMKLHDIYKEYRRTCEKLKQERVLYLTETSDYRQLEEEHDRLDLFVERCESIMAHEHGNWAQLNEKLSKDDISNG